jgi:hypothetical protein
MILERLLILLTAVNQLVRFDLGDRRRAGEKIGALGII